MEARFSPLRNIYRRLALEQILESVERAFKLEEKTLIDQTLRNDELTIQQQRAHLAQHSP